MLGQILDPISCFDRGLVTARRMLCCNTHTRPVISALDKPQQHRGMEENNPGNNKTNESRLQENTHHIVIRWELLPPKQGEREKTHSASLPPLSHTLLLLALSSHSFCSPFLSCPLPLSTHFLLLSYFSLV